MEAAPRQPLDYMGLAASRADAAGMTDVAAALRGEETTDGFARFIAGSVRTAVDATSARKPRPWRMFSQDHGDFSERAARTMFTLMGADEIPERERTSQDGMPIERRTVPVDGGTIEEQVMYATELRQPADYHSLTFHPPAPEGAGEAGMSVAPEASAGGTPGVDQPAPPAA